MTPNDPRRGIGAAGERLAAAHLEARGFELLERNFRTRHGELDLVARDGRCLVFCEVKTRVARGPPAPIGPLASIGAGKQRRLRLLACAWLAERARDHSHAPELRFDAIGVTLDRNGRLTRLEHLEGAF